MSSFKKLLAGAFALGLTTAAHAVPSATATFVRITGSTAYRGATNAAITHILTNLTYAYVGTSLSGSGTAIFHGNVGTNEVVVETAFTGSVGGIQLVGQGGTATYFVNTYADTPSNLSAGGTQYQPSTTALQGGDAAAYVPDITMSDSFQSATAFTPTNTNPLYTTALLTEFKVGIVPFKWVTSANSPVTNITPQLAQALYESGSLATSLFTGNSADSATSIFATGRDADSGTRVCAFAETGIGVGTPVQQWIPVVTGGVIQSQALSVGLTIDNIPHNTGDGGFSGGGGLAAAIGATGSLNAFNGYYVTYLSTGDAATAIGLGCHELTYNGVSESTTAVQQGQYTFWSYEHLMYLPALASDSVKLSVATTLKNQILNADATLLIGTMQVVRAQDGGLVTPKN